MKTAATGTDRTLYAAIISEQYFNTQNGWEIYSPSVLIRVDTGSAASKKDIEKLITEIVRNAGVEKRYPLMSNISIFQNHPFF